jgi:hypothetical protein
LSFTIQSNGKVASGSRIVRSAFEDATFNKCIAEVVERTTFRSFKGDPIAIAEFPITVR